MNSNSRIHNSHGPEGGSYIEINEVALVSHITTSCSAQLAPKEAALVRENRCINGISITWYVYRRIV